MSRPRKHYGQWRIRWVDEQGVRQSETYDTREDAVFALSKHELEAKEIKRGLRSPLPPDKTVGELCDYYEAKRAPLKRSMKDEAASCCGHASRRARHAHLWLDPSARPGWQCYFFTRIM